MENIWQGQNNTPMSCVSADRSLNNKSSGLCVAVLNNKYDKNNKRCTTVLNFKRCDIASGVSLLVCVAVNSHGSMHTMGNFFYCVYTMATTASSANKSDVFSLTETATIIKKEQQHTWKRESTMSSGRLIVLCSNTFDPYSMYCIYGIYLYIDKQ